MEGWMELCEIKEEALWKGSDGRVLWFAGREGEEWKEVCMWRGGTIGVGVKKKVERYLEEKCESKIFTSFIRIQRRMCT